MTAFRGFIAEFALLLAVAATVGAFNVAEAGVITWSGNTFNHSAYGGSGSSAGWQTGILGGTTTDTSGVTMTAFQTKFGTMAGGANNMQVLAFGALGNFLRWDAVTDYSSNATNPAVNYSTITLNFSSAVTVTGFGLRDVDDGSGTSWQDFIAVSAVNGAANVGVSYNLSAGGNQQLATRHGLSGVLGINGFNPSGQATADVGFTFGGALTSMTVTFLQGPGGSSAQQHLIFLNNLTVTSVPEASTLTLVGMAGAFGVILRWRRKRRSAV
jgi:hypothetical protein